MKNIITFLVLFTIPVFPGIGVGYSTVGSLPVELTSFSAKQSLNGVELSWLTASEVNNYGFEVERANSQIPNYETIWETIAFISGHGNSNSPNNYSFTDNKAPRGKSQYRLKIIDIDGAFKYSTTIEAGPIVKIFDLAQNFPNPFNPSTVISYSLPASSMVILKVYDMLGNFITTLVNDYQLAGIYKVNFNAGKLSNGIYFYKIQSGNYMSTKKMLLLK